MKVFALMMLVACGDTATPSGDIAVDNYARAFAIATCTQGLGCCKPVSNPNDPPSETVDQCETFTLQDEQASWTAVKASVTAGRVIYNDANATACLDAMTNATCTDYNAYNAQQMPAALAACQDVFTGTVAAGQPCSSIYDCADHAFCDTASPDADAPTVCIAATTVGASCRFSCYGDLYCDAGTNQCVAKKPDGATCVTGAECAGNQCNGTCLQDMTCIPSHS
ncbi:MAG: hypothetical protein QM831_21785 [Kofleriaceae bacterium]